LKIEVKKKIDVIFDFQLGRERQKLISAMKRDRRFQKYFVWR